MVKRMEFVDKLKSKLKDVDFYRIFYEESDSESVGTKDGKVETVSNNSTFGISIFYVKDNFGYIYTTNSLSKLEDFNVLDGKKLPQNINYNIKESGIKDKKVIGKKSNLDLEDLAKDFTNATKLSDKIISHNSNYSYAKRKRLIICENTEIEQETNKSFAIFSAVAKEGSKVRMDRVRLGLGSALNEHISKIFKDNEDMEINVVKKLKYKEGLTGNYDIILDPDLSDLLAHEAIGHATESDLVYEGFSVLKGQIGKQLAPDFVTMYDDPTPRDNLLGSFYYDDEGFAAKNKELIKDGKLNDYIFNQKYSDLMGMENNGGARMESYNYHPIPRMSNTSFKAGKTSLEDMIKDTKNGVLLSGGSGGQVDPSSGVFQFGVKEGFIIKDGELGEEYVNLTFSGNIMEMLHNIVDISRDVKKNQPGFCGKSGQAVPVGGFGPYMKLNNIRLG